MPEVSSIGRRSWPNPAAYRPTQVTTAITLVYVVLFALLLWVHHDAPTAPREDSPLPGVSQSEAWRDLQELSRSYRPFNSHRNDEVMDWLVNRAQTLVAKNNRAVVIASDQGTAKTALDSDVVIWKDLQSNVTFLDQWRGKPWSCYIESQNVLIYVRGTDDEAGAWWEHPYRSKQGILVNAHYDSVSTGYGATDDGCGVVTILQLISHYTTPGNTPRQGIIFLLNDGEEDGLYGAHAFSQHPWSSFPGVFLNLEGAGAGGRATLFRSTDADITSFYAESPHPFGTVLSADGFKRGLVRSGTDYSVFTDDLDIRGLDVAFMEPRSRYHTDQDAARDTSPDSLWHMLSTALATTKALDAYDGDWEPLSTTSNDAGVWFDVFGAAFAVLTLYVFSASAIALLVVIPLLLALLITYLVSTEKWYLFVLARDGPHATPGLRRMKGFFRLPIALIVSVLVLYAMEYLIEAQNPYIVYRYPYAVWTAFISGCFVTTWAILRLADHTRPTVFSRWYAVLWIYILSWLALVIATNSAITQGLGSGYFVLIYHISALLALILGTIEFFALPERQHRDAPSAENIENGASGQAHTEQTPLLSANARDQTSIGVDRQQDDIAGAEHQLVKPGSSDDQPNLPSWTWLIQFLLLAPINIIFVGQIGLFLTSALHQTPADGNDVSTIYQSILGCSILLIVPILPFIHKVRPALPFLLFIVAIASLLWTIIAFPFSRDARLKYYFLQEVDLKAGANNVSLTALAPYLQTIVSEMPSTEGRQIDCRQSGQGLRIGLPTCTWHGIEPEPVESVPHNYTDWLQYNITAVNASYASFSLQGKHTKNCRVMFDTPVQTITIDEAVSDDRHDTIAEGGNTQVRLFSRSWDKRFVVNVSWAQDQTVSGQTGRIGCMWAELEDVPAAKELQIFAPVWSALTKQDDGLIEGWYDWRI